MIDNLGLIAENINLPALAALLLAVPAGLAIAFFCTRRGYANYENEIGGKHYKPKHFFKELFWRYPSKRYGLRYKDENSEDSKNNCPNKYNAKQKP